MQGSLLGVGFVVTLSNRVHVSSPDGLVCLSAHAFLLLFLPGRPDGNTATTGAGRGTVLWAFLCVG